MVPILSVILFVLLVSCGGETQNEAGTLSKENLKALMDPTSAEMKQEAPAQFKAQFNTNKGKFVIQVTREWAPLGADRFYNLVKHGFYDNNRFFRVMPNFVVQWGIHGDPAISKLWTANPQVNPELHDKVAIKNDPVIESNRRGTVVFAKANAPDTRTTQLFINLADNEHLAKYDGFAPFGEVVEGMEVVDSFNSGYGSGPQNSQQEIILQGNAFLAERFPELDYIESAQIVE